MSKDENNGQTDDQEPAFSISASLEGLSREQQIELVKRLRERYSEKPDHNQESDEVD
jgi:hypothetical protein